MESLEMESRYYYKTLQEYLEHQTGCNVYVPVKHFDSSETGSSPSVKKKKYLQPNLDHRRHFFPFEDACDGELGNEAKVVLQNPA